MKISIIIAFGLIFILNSSLGEAAASCGVSSAGMSFGAINPLSTAEVSTVAEINLVCTGGSVTYTIALSQGNGSMLQRVMKSGLNNLKYNIYTTSSYLTVVGDGSAGSATINGLSSTASTAVTYFVFGKVSNIGLPATVAGAYTDSISVTISY